ncbi:jg13894, partial [Pararge aegeria aegeria]
LGRWWPSIPTIVQKIVPSEIAWNREGGTREGKDINTPLSQETHWVPECIQLPLASTSCRPTGGVFKAKFITQQIAGLRRRHAFFRTRLPGYIVIQIVHIP